MTLDTVIMLTGAAIALLPFLGFPQRWDTVLFFLLGVLVIALGIIVRRRGPHPGAQRSARTGTFVETGSTHEPHEDDAS